MQPEDFIATVERMTKAALPLCPENCRFALVLQEKAEPFMCGASGNGQTNDDVDRLLASYLNERNVELYRRGE